MLPKKDFKIWGKLFCYSIKNIKFAPCFKTILKFRFMSRICEISGRRAMFGNNVSKAVNKTKRRFEVNLIKKRFFIPEEDKWINLKVTASVLKTINRKGISEVLKDARAKGKSI